MLNLIGIKMALSYLFCYLVILSFTSCIIFIEKHFSIDYSNHINGIDVIVHTFILISIVLMLTHFHDMYYSVFMLITQIAIAITSKASFSDNSIYILVIIILNCFCIGYSVFWYMFKRPLNDEKENEDFFKNVDKMDMFNH